MLTTRFTELVGCSVPIQQAGMGDLATPGLAAAVAEFSEILRKSFWAKDGKLEDVLAVLQNLPGELRNDANVVELTDLVNKAIKIQKTEVDEEL